MNLIVRNHSRSWIAVLAQTFPAIDCVVLYYYGATSGSLQIELFLLHHQTWMLQDSRLIHDWSFSSNDSTF